MDIQALTARVIELEKTVLNLESIYSARRSLTELEAEIVEDIHYLTQFWSRLKECFCVR
jgi:hypothetical protein